MRTDVTLADGTRASTKTIAEMSALYQISLRTLRFYEDRGLIAPTRVGAQRLYAAKDEVRLQIVLKGKRLGFTLSEIERLILSGVDSHPDAMHLAPEQAAAVALTPALVRQKIEKLEQMRETTNEAIAELTARMRETEPV